MLTLEEVKQAREQIDKEFGEIDFATFLYDPKVAELEERLVILQEDCPHEPYFAERKTGFCRYCGLRK